MNKYTVSILRDFILVDDTCQCHIQNHSILSLEPKEAKGCRGKNASQRQQIVKFDHQRSAEPGRGV